MFLLPWLNERWETIDVRLLITGKLARVFGDDLTSIDGIAPWVFAGSIWEAKRNARCSVPAAVVKRTTMSPESFTEGVPIAVTPRVGASVFLLATTKNASPLSCVARQFDKFQHAKSDVSASRCG